MELDHIFMFCNPGDGSEELLTSFGLVETYRRQHPGQGTENICFCFDNAFIELLWVNNDEELVSPPIARTRLYERSRHRDLGTCPFGIAWRGINHTASWPFRPPYLPAHMSIDVATDGDDPTQPMMFRSPGHSPPSSWPTERRGNLQRAAGFGELRIQKITMPLGISPSSTLLHMAEDIGFSISISGHSYRMELEIDRSNGDGAINLALQYDQVTG